MLVEVSKRLQLVTSDQGRSSGFFDNDVETDPGSGQVAWWDKVAERWPNGGRFPSFISIDQSA